MTNNEHPTYKSVLIHASAVEYRGKALVFLGPSGTGKSTISQLLAATLDGVRVLADDVVDLDWQTDGGWTVGDAWTRILQQSSRPRIAPVSLHTPLGAIFRLYQAPSTRLKALHVLDTCLYLVKAFAEIKHGQAKDIEQKRMCFTSLAAVARKVPGYEFYCVRAAQTADVLQQEATFA